MHRVPGNATECVRSPDPCMPTPMIAKRTGSLPLSPWSTGVCAASGTACVPMVVAAAAATAEDRRNWRRVNSGFIEGSMLRVVRLDCSRAQWQLEAHENCSLCGSCVDPCIVNWQLYATHRILAHLRSSSSDLASPARKSQWIWCAIRRSFTASYTCGGRMAFVFNWPLLA